MSVFKDLYNERENYQNLAFWRQVLLYMQQDPGNTTTQCITQFDTFTTSYSSILAEVADDTSYLAGLAAKGQGAGTDTGFLIAKGQAYIDVAISSVNVFNYCDLDYYLIAIGKAVGSSSGFVNQSFNLGFRFFSQEDNINYYEMSVGMINDDSDAVGAGLGKFISALLMVDVPETTVTSSYSSVGQLM